MPHQCVRCGKIYDDGSNEILTGCTECGGKLFFFIRKESLKKAEELTKDLTEKDKKEIESDIKALIDYDEKDEKPVVLDFESIRVLEPGKFEIDIVNLFKHEPVIYKLNEGKYFIDLPATFDSLKKRKNLRLNVDNINEEIDRDIDKENFDENDDMSNEEE